MLNHRLSKARYLFATIALLTFMVSVSASETCKNSDLTVQVLGSGGPIADDDRASSGYLVWHEGKSRFLIDAGGGIFLRFAEAKANMEDLDAIAMSHFHVDHSADLPALLKSAYFSERKSPLIISGPSRNQTFPNTNEFLSAMFDAKQGAFRYLAGYLDGSDGLFKLNPVVVDTSQKGETLILKSDDAELDALSVPHGPVPALAYRLDIDGKRIVFSSDQNGSNPEFIKFSKDADILIFHMAIPEVTSGPQADNVLHALPSRIGEIAEQAHVKTLVLSHLMQRSLKDLDKNVELVKQHYKGNVIVANDLQCFPLDT